MLTRRTAITTAVSLLFAPIAMAYAEAPVFQTYTPASFAAAQASGKPILIAIHAVWCPTCKVQKIILNDLLKKSEFKDLVVLRVDFDDQKDAVAGFGANSQSTLIVFKGKAEMGRSVGTTSAKNIEQLLHQAI